jgi:hypothetical protein
MMEITTVATVPEAADENSDGAYWKKYRAVGVA